ncbi:MAG TPA: porin, partial [Burkholderiales bacterium]|nr:porin [Burkholderiales bacterium]
AVAGIFVPSFVMADDSTVTLYGKLSVGVESIKAEGAANSAQDIKSRVRVTDAASYIGFRGVEPLGGGVSAFFQVENLVKPDSGPGRTTFTTANTFANRNSGVGLRGAFGEIMLGRWDVFYTNHIPAGDQLFVKSAYASTVLAVMGGGAAGLGGLVSVLGSGNPNEGRGLTDFGGRRDNVVRYISPNLAGFTGKVSYVAPENTTTYATDSAFSNAGEAKDSGIEASLTYLNKKIGFFNYSYFKRNDYLGLTGVGTAVAPVVGNDSTSHKVALGTKLAGFTIGALWDRIRHENPDLNFTVAADQVDRERDAYGVFAAYETGRWAFGTSFAKADEVEDKVAGTDLADTDARFFQLSANYNISKRTTIYATYAKITNEASAMYDFFAQAAVSDSGPGFIGLGSDPTTLIIGINHYF